MTRLFVGAATAFVLLSSTALAAIPAPIQHVIVIVQENRSFDEYFGTYPGADGLPPGGASIPDPAVGGVARSYHDTSDKTLDNPHGVADMVPDIDGGKMDGFVEVVEANASRRIRQHCAVGNGPTCLIDVMGYKDRSDIPNYWAYADAYALQDGMYTPVGAYSAIQHLMMVSGWAAECGGSRNPMDCATYVTNTPGWLGTGGQPPPQVFAWTDVTWLLTNSGVSWAYYRVNGNEPDCTNPVHLSCDGTTTGSERITNSYWSPLPWFVDVQDAGTAGNVQSVSNYYADTSAAICALPSVSWVVPAGPVSEHPPHLVSEGQAFVTSLINSLMSGPCWGSSAIFLTWDDWGGYYDHVRPPVADSIGYGFRVPALIISPYVRRGIYHEPMSFDSYLTFIEDLFLHGRRINPATDGRADPRPDMRDDPETMMLTMPDGTRRHPGRFIKAFDFTQAPLPPLILPVIP